MKTCSLLARCAFLALGFSLNGCGDSAPPSDSKEAAGLEPAQQVSVRPTKDSNQSAAHVSSDPAPAPLTPAAAKHSTQYQLLCDARKFPTKIPPGPPPQYFLRGKVLFVPSDPNAATVEQDLSIAVGGPDRMKTELHKDRQRQVFFLADANQAWLKRAGKKANEIEEYDPVDLANDNAVRWLALQFPWPLQDQLQAETQSEPSIPSEVLFKEPDENGSTWELKLSPKGLLRSISHVGTEETDLRLELSDWKPATSGGLFPMVWIWHYSWGQMEEHFDSCSDEALFLDSWFNPLPSQAKKQNFLNEPSGRLSPIRLADQLTVVEQPLLWVEQEDWKKIPAPPAAQLWNIHSKDGRSWTVFTPLDPKVILPDTVPTFTMPEDQLWLRWRSFYDQPAKEAAETLRKMAQRNGLNPLGPVWIRNPPPGSVRGAKLYLVPVSRK